MTSITKCSIEECPKQADVLGWCRKHYMRNYIHGDPTFSKYEHHGMKNSKMYMVWTQMKRRCNQPTHKDYRLYGGRGITVCERWLHSFKNFYEDMGDKPSPSHSLDRINNDGNYEPDNCKWSTPKEQRNNQRGMIK